MTRAAIVAFLVIFCTTILYFRNGNPRPAPVVVHQIDYCVISERAAARDAFGEWHFGWATGYGPCSKNGFQQADRYENI